MNSKIVIAMCFLVCGAAAFSPRVPTKRNPHEMLLDIMLKSLNDGVRLDADEVKKCFDDAAAKAGEIVTAFEMAYTACQTEATSGKALLSEESLESRNKLRSDAAAVCEMLTNCDTETDAVAFFTCFNSAASDGSSSLRSIAGSSNSEKLSYEAKYQVIEHDLGMCCTVAENKYQADTQSNADELTSCLAA